MLIGSHGGEVSRGVTPRGRQGRITRGGPITRGGQKVAGRNARENLAQECEDGTSLRNLAIPLQTPQTCYGISAAQTTCAKPLPMRAQATTALSRNRGGQMRLQAVMANHGAGDVPKEIAPPQDAL